MYGVVLRAHSVRGESHIQHNANGEVATLQTVTAEFEMKKQSTRVLTLRSIVHLGAITPEACRGVVVSRANA